MSGSIACQSLSSDFGIPACDESFECRLDNPSPNLDAFGPEIICDLRLCWLVRVRGHLGVLLLVGCGMDMEPSTKSCGSGHPALTPRRVALDYHAPSSDTSVRDWHRVRFHETVPIR